jgi:hypothetical protein
MHACCALHMSFQSHAKRCCELPERSHGTCERAAGGLQRASVRALVRRMRHPARCASAGWPANAAPAQHPYIFIVWTHAVAGYRMNEFCLPVGVAIARATMRVVACVRGSLSLVRYQ